MITSVYAQKKDYSRGYVIYPDGDTLEGWVKDRSSGPFMDLYSSIRFKAENSLFKKKYSPNEIMGYRTGEYMYESVPLREDSEFFRFNYYLHEDLERVFLKLISRDKGLSYYHWEYLDDDSNYLDYIPLFYISGSNEMVRVTQGILGLKRKKLINYFNDCPDLGYAIYTKELNDIHEVYDFYLDQCADH